MTWRPIAIALLLALASVGYAAPPDPAELAQRIDQRLAEGWKKAGVEPAAPCDDSALLRRMYVDLAGRIPTVAQTRAFLDDSRPDKRAELVDSLLGSGAHATHFATFWRRTWIPQADAPQFAGLADDVERWLAVRLQANAPYDRLVLELLSFPSNGKISATADQAPAGASHSFYAASEFKPENLAANTTRAFLGINLDCAQCHDHPFSRWTREQFWQTAAFFSRPSPAAKGKPPRLELAIANTDKVVTPVLLTNRELKWPDQLEADTGRQLLARWVTSPDNPYLARNAVNRLWACFLGAGLVEPLDDLSSDNPPSHPELLDELSQAFIASGFDLNYMTKALILSRAYQQSSATPSAASAKASAADDARLFARMPVRALTGEQLYASLRIAAGLPSERDDVAGPEASVARQRFVAQFRVERAATAQRSIVQALALMNGRLTSDLTDVQTSPALCAVASAPFLDCAGESRRCSWPHCADGPPTTSWRRLWPTSNRAARPRILKRPWPMCSGPCSTPASSTRIVDGIRLCREGDV